MTEELSEPLLPSGHLDALRRATIARADIGHAASHIDEIAQLLGSDLAVLETKLAEALTGPGPLDAAAANLVLAGGKRVRPLTALLAASACGGQPSRAIGIAAAAELVHSATLLHDDVIDEGEERRGRATSRVLWGNLVSVLAGDLMLTRALELVERAGVPGVMPDLLQTLQALIAGEVEQLQARDREDLGTEGYLRIVRGKTAALFAFSCRAGARSAGAPDKLVAALGRFGEKLGVAFQVIDDVLDLSGDPQLVGKRLGADLAEGKTTLPLALALTVDAPALRPLLERARRGDAAAAATLATSPSVRRACETARGQAREWTDGGLSEISLLPPSRARELLVSIVRELVARSA